MNKTIVITGPTASGKSDVAIEIASRINGEILSADSMQIYEGLNIGTAKLKDADRHAIKHYFIDIVKPDAQFSAIEFKNKALDIIADIEARGKTPIVAGGTGFYVSALLYPMSVEGVAKDEEFREKHFAMAREKGNEHVYNLLQIQDSASAEKLHANDIKRVVRALEILHVSNTKKSQANYGIKNLESVNIPHTIFSLSLPREVLYQRINNRVDVMLAKGLINEVKGLAELGYDIANQSMQAIGYKEILQYLSGEFTLEQAVDLIKQRSRNYAKRQLTFIRNSLKDVNYIDSSSFDTKKIADEIMLNLALKKKNSSKILN